MLDNFRETAITWDKANRKVYEPLRVSAGDNKGRKLSVQVVNGGVVENITGSSLSLFWETRDKAHRGLDVFTAVDATKGEFEIYYTTGMLSNEGVLNANLVLVDTSGRVVSEPFTITVFKGIDDNAIQSSDSFTALTEALIDISDLEQNYAPRLNDLTAQLQQTDGRIDNLIVGFPQEGEIIDSRHSDTWGQLFGSLDSRLEYDEILLKGKANKQQEAWITPTLLNGVTNYARGMSPVRYYKNEFNAVCLDGISSIVAVGIIIFTLPVGYRPSKRLYIPTVVGNVFGFVEIGTDGNVKLGTNSASYIYISFSGITFRAEG